MTLDEAIKHAEEVAEKKENEGKLLCQNEGESIGCLACAEEHIQLAEWLKDYKQQTEVFDKIRAEILVLDDADYDFEGYYKAVTDVLQIIDKYSRK